MVFRGLPCLPWIFNCGVRVKIRVNMDETDRVAVTDNSRGLQSTEARGSGICRVATAEAHSRRLRTWIAVLGHPSVHALAGEKRVPAEHGV